MPLKVRDLNTSARKFAERAAAAQPDYVSGVQGSGAAWEQATASSEQNYNDGVQAAIGRGAFARGVKNAGGAYFETRAVQIGGARFAQGVRAGQDNWAEGFKVSADTLRNLTLPPRAPKGDPRNAQRSLDVQTALRRAKTGQ